MAETPYTGVDNLEVLEEAVRYNRFLLGLILDARGTAARAVDFGAGTGTLAEAARDAGLPVSCMEPDAGLRERLRESGFEVYESLTALADMSCPYIYSFNVLEHIEDDASALADLHTKLTPGGRLLLYVPAFGLLFSDMDRKVGHFRRYRRAPLVALARDAGFTVESARYADSLGFFAALLYKFFGSREGDISPGPIRIYDRWVFPLSRLLDRLGLSWLLGKNLVLVLRKEKG